jgi:hypothetical protein
VRAPWPLAVLLGLAACARFSSAGDEPADQTDGGAGADAGSASDGGAAARDAGFCPDAARLCDDFERQVTNLQGPWGFLYGNDGGMRLDDSVASSQSTSLSIDDPATKPVDYALGLDLVDAPGQIEVALSMRTTAASSAQHHFVTVIFETDHFAHLMVRDGTLFLVEQVGSNVYEETWVREVPQRVFTRYALRITNNAVARKMELTSGDGVVLGSRLLSTPHGAISKVLVGAPYIAVGTPVKLWLDDVAITTTP